MQYFGLTKIIHLIIKFNNISFKGIGKDATGLNANGLMAYCKSSCPADGATEHTSTESTAVAGHINEIKCVNSRGSIGSPSYTTWHHTGIKWA